MFVQDIDARKPLSGRSRIRDEEPGQDEPSADRDHDREQDEGTRAGIEDSREQRSSSRASGIGGSGESSTQGPMLTSQMDVDERLRQMNATFLASLEGFSVGRRDRKHGDDAQSGGSDEGNEWRDVRGESGSRSGARRRRTVPQYRTQGSRGSSVGAPSHTGSDMGSGGRGDMPGSDSASSVGAVQGSEEIIGRLELDDGRPKSERLGYVLE